MNSSALKILILFLLVGFDWCQQNSTSISPTTSSITKGQSKASTIRQPTAQSKAPATSKTTAIYTTIVSGSGSESISTDGGENTTDISDTESTPGNETITKESSPVSQSTTTTTTTTPEPPILSLNPPNYRYKVLKYYHEDYITPSIFLLIGLIIIILTIAFHYYMDSKEKQRQIATGTRYKPDKKRKDSTVKSPEKSLSPSKSTEKSPQTGDVSTK